MYSNINDYDVHFALIGNGRCLASFPGSLSPFKLCLHEYVQKVKGEGEPGTKLHPPVAFFNCIFLPNHGWEVHWWAQFHTRLSVSFNLSCLMLAQAEFEERERESLGTRLDFAINSCMWLMDLSCSKNSYGHECSCFCKQPLLPLWLCLSTFHVGSAWAGTGWVGRKSNKHVTWVVWFLHMTGTGWNSP